MMYQRLFPYTLYVQAGDNPPPPTPPVPLTGIFHESIATFQNTNWLSSDYSFAWETMFQAPQFGYLYSIGYFGEHAPVSTNLDNSVRILTPTGPDTAVASYSTSWDQYTDSSHVTPLVPPGAGWNANSPCDDNYPTLYLPQSNSLVWTGHQAVDCHAGEVIAGVRFPQTVLPGEYCISGDAGFDAGFIYNPQLAWCVENNWAVAYGVSYGQSYTSELNRTLRIFKPTGDPDAPYDATDSTYILDVGDAALNGLTGIIRGRNSCAIIGTKMYIGGGEAAYLAVGSNSNNLVFNVLHGFSVGDEIYVSQNGTPPDDPIVSGLLNLHVYYVSAVLDTLTLKISETLGGPSKTDIADSGGYFSDSHPSNNRLMVIDIAAVDGGNLAAITMLNTRYANGTTTLQYSAMCADPINNCLYDLGSVLTRYDIDSDTWETVDVADFPDGGYQYCQLKYEPKYHALFGRGSLASDGSGDRNWFSIELPAVPINLGQYTNQYEIDSQLTYNWNNQGGDFRNYSGTPGEPGTYQDESDPYAELMVAASDPLGTEYTSDDLTPMMDESLANPTFGITLRLTSGSGMKMALSNYGIGTQGPKLVISRAGHTDLVLSGDFEWNFSAPPDEDTDLFITIGAFHFAWPDGLVYADITNTRFKATKVVNGTDSTYGLYLLAPHPVVFAPDSSEFGFSQEATTTDPVDKEYDYADLAADMPASAAAAGFNSAGSPQVPPTSTWGDPGSRVQPDGRGGAFIKMNGDGSSHVGCDNWMTLPDVGMDAVFTGGMAFGSEVGDVDRCKFHPSIFSGNVSEGTDVGCAVLWYISKGSSQNPAYIGGNLGVYQAPLTNSDVTFVGWNVHQMLFLKGGQGMGPQYLVQIKITNNTFVMGVGQHDGIVDVLIDGVLMIHKTGLILSLAEDSVIQAYRAEWYHGGPAFATHDAFLAVNNYKFRAGADWIANSLFRYGAP